MMVVAGTGHRPEDAEPENIVREKIHDTLTSTVPDAVITGCAAGFDLWLGDIAIVLGIEVWAAKPWAGHVPRAADRELYARVIEGASKIVNVTPHESYPGPWAYHVRNEWMVDHATHVLAYWSGKKTGGTYACLQYASKKGVKVRNIYG